jgi:hypothetical protein
VSQALCLSVRKAPLQLTPTATTLFKAAPVPGKPAHASVHMCIYPTCSALPAAVSNLAIEGRPDEGYHLQEQWSLRSSFDKQ